MAIINGIVLNTKQYKDNDLLVRILTETAGLRTFLARGAKRPKSKLAGGVQPYALITFEGAWPKKGSGLGYINDIQSVKMFSRLVDDIEVNAYAALIVSLIDATFEFYIFHL